MARVLSAGLCWLSKAIRIWSALAERKLGLQAGRPRPTGDRLSSKCLPTPDGTIITGNTRLMRALRREYDISRKDSGAKTWDSPDVISYSGWLHRAWEECVYRDESVDTPVLLTDAQEQELWEDAIAKSGVSGPLLNIPETARTAAIARDLLVQWRVPFEESGFQGLEDTEAFFGWLTLFDRRLAENGWITTSQLPGAIEDRLGNVRKVVPGPLTLTGFDEFPPASRGLFDALRRTGCMISKKPDPRRSSGETAARVECHDAADEFRAAAAWVRSKLEADSKMRIGIVVRGLAQSSVVVERTFDDTLHADPNFRMAGRRRAFQLSSGTRASEAPLIAAALSLLKLVPGMPLAEGLMLFRSPFFGTDATAGAQLENELRRFGTETVSIEMDHVRRHFPDITAKMAAGGALSGERRRPGQWSAHFSKLAVAAGWPGVRKLSSAERQAVEIWDASLSSLARLDVVTPRLTFNAALARLGGIVSAKRLPPADDDASVEIMDVQDSIAGEFDALWFAGAHAAAWPAPPRSNPFLPANLQRNARMPHSSSEWELDYARRATDRLLASSQETICSNPRFSQEEPLRPSPLIELLPLVNGPPRFEGTALSRVFGMAVPLEKLPLGRAPELPPGTLQSGGTSVIADQSACPFRAFAKHRLGAREMDDIPLGISPAEHGNVAHAALETFWRDMGNQDELLSRSQSDVRDVIVSAVSAALDVKLGRREKNPAMERFRAFEEARLARLIEEWIDVERRRRPFSVIQHETSETVEVEGLQLKIRVDRIDRYDDGTHAILDYKTGADISKDKWDSDRPEEPQLPLYAVTDKMRAISEVAFARITPGKIQLIAENGDNLQRRLPEWKRVVSNLAMRFQSGEADVDPKNPPKTCTFCGLQPLCRIHEVRGTALAVEDEFE